MPFERTRHSQSEPRRIGSVDKQLEELFAGQANSLTEAQRTAVDALEAEDTADATDEASAVTLSNALKVKVNEIIAALQAE